MKCGKSENAHKEMREDYNNYAPKTETQEMMNGLKELQEHMQSAAGTGQLTGSEVTAKLLITGQTEADLASIQSSLKQCEVPGDLLLQMSELTGTRMQLSRGNIGKFMDWDQLSSASYKIVVIAVDGRDLKTPIVGANGRVSHLYDRLVMHGLHTDSIYFLVTNDEGARGMTSTEFASTDLLHRLGPIQLSLLQEFIDAARFMSWGDHGPANHQLRRLRTLLHTTARSQVGVCSHNPLIISPTHPVVFVTTSCRWGLTQRVSAAPVARRT
jgi:hypothetical protein